MSVQDDLREPLVPKATFANSKLVMLVSFFLHLAMAGFAYYIIKDDPQCDQPLVLWTKWIIVTTLIGGALQLVKLVLGLDALVACLQGLVGAVSGVVWVWGHWPVYESEVCDEALWNFVFVIETLGDIGVVVMLVVVCVMVRKLV